ncbi:hypothetical protein [Streptococcus suis]|uniref:hypothetical protein n=1 Tax=Streptococcus suis TaxID=1307 RepID=UPI001E3F25E0|nr:hypothetical protein [Streptococcus suis]
MKIKVNRIAEQKINRGIQLLDSADFSGVSFDEDRLAVLYSESGSYLGQAYFPTLSLYFSTIQFNRLIELDFLSIFSSFICVVCCCML